MKKDWEEDSDPCNDCGQPANYDERTGWYYHTDPKAPPCFLMGSKEEDPYLANATADMTLWFMEHPRNCEAGCRCL